MNSALTRSSLRRLSQTLRGSLEDITCARVSASSEQVDIVLAFPRFATSTASTASTASTSSGHVHVACVALERLPLLAPLVPAYEAAYKAWSAQWNAARFKTLPESFVVTESTTMTSGSGGQGDGAAWQPATRETAADRANDVRSLNRRLDTRLFLLVKKAGLWGFVEGELATNGSDSGGKSSRVVAEEALAAVMGEGEKREGDSEKGEKAPPVHYFVGNAPAAHTVGRDNTLRFYHRCQLVQPALFDGGALLARGGYEDYAWVGVDELGAYLGGDDARVATLQAMA